MTFSSGCSSTNKGIELDIPEDVRTQLEAGAPRGEFVFYALQESAPASWDDLRERGLWLCGELPPLIPDKYKSLLKGGGFPPGTAVTISQDSDEMKKLGMDAVVTVGITFEGCVEGAIDRMKQSRGLVLLTERSASFDGKETMVEISFE
jgi:nicotinamidase-related amidase